MSRHTISLITQIVLVELMGKAVVLTPTGTHKTRKHFHKEYIPVLVSYILFTSRWYSWDVSHVHFVAISVLAPCSHSLLSNFLAKHLECETDGSLLLWIGGPSGSPICLA